MLEHSLFRVVMAALQQTVRSELTPFTAYYLADEWHKNVDSYADADPSPINAEPLSNQFSNQNQYRRRTNDIPNVRLARQWRELPPYQPLFDIPAPQSRRNKYSKYNAHQ